MRKVFWLLILLCIPFYCIAQAYRHIGVDDGLSNRRVYAIQKDSQGYMWFLNHNGIDRYDGKEFKQYKLLDGEREANSMVNLNWLYVDTDGELWQIGKQGRVFHYNSTHDRFQLVFKLPLNLFQDTLSPVSFGFVDRSNIVWLCTEETIYLYNSRTQERFMLRNELDENITCIAQIDATHYYIGTDVALHYAELKDNVLTYSHKEILHTINEQTTEIFFHKNSHKLFIGTFQRGMYMYDKKTNKISKLETGLMDVSITRIRALNDTEILIATDGAGIYKLDINTHECKPYIIADYNRYNAMNGNSIYDMYIDESRIWIVNYPFGITVYNSQYVNYNWIKHSIGNKQSLINDHVNEIIEDQDGDLWFATNNGVSLYNPRTNQWHSFLSTFDTTNKNQIFISLCEVSPGVIWVGGYISGVYEIRKKDLSVKLLTPTLYNTPAIQPDKYIRSISKDSSQELWLGGYYNLSKINLQTKEMRLFPELNGITDVIEKDSHYMWIGTSRGLYSLNKQTGESKHINLPVESYYIYALYQARNGLLYIGTNNSGLLIYDPSKDTFEHYHKENCALISNTVYGILSDEDQNILLSTENGLASFYPKEKSFYNWTKEQGLMTSHFNPTSGTLRKNGNFILGSTNGVVEFNKDSMLPRKYQFKMIFSEFQLFYQAVYPGDENSPLKVDIDETQTLRLKHNQNIFSLRVSSINYDYPSFLLYSWKLDGLYDGWSQPEQDCVIRFTNLSPGKYTLHVRAISSEDHQITLEERRLQIIIEHPFWLTVWALLFYAIIIIGIAFIFLRIIFMRRQRKISDEKIDFFINTAHDIRTPLTLIKAPLEELSEKETLSENGQSNMDTALRNVNALLRLTTNLINFERADTYSNDLYVSEYELRAYLEEMVNSFQSYAEVKQISLTYESNLQYLNTWFDKDKMDSIFKNVITNALKYTPEGGSVHISTTETNETWSVEVKDTGIGIPSSEQKKMFKMHFRGSNAINSKVTGSGIGLLLVWKLVRLHKGKISFSSTEGKGTSVKVTFPKGEKYQKAIRTLQPGGENIVYSESGVPQNISSTPIYKDIQQNLSTDKHSKLLIVEDNDELRGYLQNTLSNEYIIQVCTNGKEALNIVKEYMPDLVISDIMMPEMRGDELCNILKNDIDTSHIPIILLTALNTDKHIIEGLQIGADEYVVKPFNIGILRATIANILSNRALLRRRYANLDLTDDSNDAECINCSSDLDWKFIATVKKNVEENLDNPTFNVDTLCGLLHMSRTSFYNKIKALTDQAPADYIRFIRLKRASQLLKEQKHTITEIAEITGFNDAKYFREVFKKHFKVSPSQYAKQGGSIQEPASEK